MRDWTPADYATALAGDCGLVCREIRRMRGLAAIPEDVSAVDSTKYKVHKMAITEQLAELVIFADLLATRFGIDLGDAVHRHFNKVSGLLGSKVKL